MDRPSPHPYVAADPPVGIAHRGGAGDAPENTLSAFRAAAALGYVHMETDVHTTSDGVLVAFHDPELDRVTDHRGELSALTWEELSRVRIDGLEQIPRLVDLLEALPACRFSIDPKHDSAVEPLIELFDRAELLDRVCIAAFSDRRLRTIRRRLGSGVCTSLGPVEIARLVLRSFGLPVGRPAGQVASLPRWLLSVDFVARRVILTARRLDLVVHVWTVDDPVEMERLLDLGVHGIMTDRPGTLASALAARGAWPPPSEATMGEGL